METASALAFTVTGGPPDEHLLAAAEASRLATAGDREREARRLLARSSTRHHFRHFVLEWLEVDRITDTAKNAEQFPKYDYYKTKMLGETQAFVDEVMVNHGASLSALLTARFASVEPSMARYYGLDAWGPRVSLDGTGRSGLLQQASFLSVHAHEDSTSPVKRGDFVMRKLLCTTLPRPQELDIEVTIPQPTPSQTTRQRFADHVTNTTCQACHAPIDSLGFTFENFDGAGRARTHENDKPVVTTGSFDHDDMQARFSDSVELANWLAANPVATECFARHAVRYFTAQKDPALEGSLARIISALPKGSRDNLTEMLVAFVRSEEFVLRRTSP
jgi:hypothetical protein